jgi:hypothetical protein
VDEGVIVVAVPVIAHRAMADSFNIVSPEV